MNPEPSRSHTDTRYRTIVADPPWPYAGRPGRYPDPRLKTPGRAGPSLPMPYPTMTLGEIAALPVGDLAEPDSHLYLWTTQRFIYDAFRLVDTWGFRYSTLLVWSKKPKGIAGTFINSAEFVLFARRGTLPSLSKHLGSVFTWPRHEKADHSRKPEAFLDLVESVSPGPYLELFARRQRLGWDTWGNEALEHVSL